MQERERDIELPSIKEKKDIEEETDAKNAEVLEDVTRSPQDLPVGLIQECSRNKIEQPSHDCEICGKTFKSKMSSPIMIMRYVEGAVQP